MILASSTYQGWECHECGVWQQYVKTSERDYLGNIEKDKGFLHEVIEHYKESHEDIVALIVFSGRPFTYGLTDAPHKYWAEVSWNEDREYAASLDKQF